MKLEVDFANCLLLLLMKSSLTTLKLPYSLKKVILLLPPSAAPPGSKIAKYHRSIKPSRIEATAFLRLRVTLNQWSLWSLSLLMIPVSWRCDWFSQLEIVFGEPNSFPYTLTTMKVVLGSFACITHSTNQEPRKMTCWYSNGPIRGQSLRLLT